MYSATTRLSPALWITGLALLLALASRVSAAPGVNPTMSYELPGSSLTHQSRAPQTSINETTQTVESDRRFVLTAILFNQTTVLDSLDLLASYEAYLGTVVNVADIRQICRSILNNYRHAGYQNASCTLPAQTITEGVVRLVISEDVISRVRLTGDPVADDSIIYRYLENIPLNRALDQQSLLLTSRLINALPGISATASVQEVEGTHDIELIFDIRKTSSEFDVFLNNRGTRLTGENQGGIVATGNSMLGMDERLQLYWLNSTRTEGLQHLALESAWPFGGAGSTFNLNVSHTRSEPGDFLRDSAIVAKLDEASMGWRYPVSHGDDHALSFGTWLEYSKADLVAANTPLSLDEVYSFNLEADYRHIQVSSYTQYLLVYKHALSSMNETRLLTDTGFEPSGLEAYDYLTFDINHLLALTSSWQLGLKLKSQYAFDPLPATEVIAFGGESTGVAYDPAELIGDHGLAAQYKLSYVQTFSADSSASTYFINDVARVWAYNTSERTTASSVALGYSFQYGYLVADIQLTKALNREIALEGNRDARVFGSIELLF